MSCESWSGTCTCMEFQSCAASERRCDGAILFTQSEGAMSCESWSGTCTSWSFSPALRAQVRRSGSFHAIGGRHVV